MIFTNNLGVFSSIQAVWEEYPSGGVLGDYVQVSGQIYGWNVTQRQWTLPDASTSRIAVPFVIVSISFPFLESFC